MPPIERHSLGLLDDLQAVAARVMKGEHRWNSVPVHQLTDIDPIVTQPLMRCGGVGAGEPNANRQRHRDRSAALTHKGEASSVKLNKA